MWSLVIRDPHRALGLDSLDPHRPEARRKVGASQRQTETDRDRDRDRDRNRETDRKKDTQTDSQSVSQTDRQTDRQGEGEREGERPAARREVGVAAVDEVWVVQRDVSGLCRGGGA